MQDEKCLGIIDLVNEKSPCHYNEGDLIIEQGKKIHCILYIENGTAKIVHNNSKGKAFTFLDAHQGDYLGIHSLLNKENSFVSVVATGPLKAYKITEETLRYIIERKIEVSLELMKQLCSRIGLIEAKIAKNFQMNSKGKLAEILLSTNKYGITADQSISYSSSELAESVGTTKNYICKILFEFQQLKALSIKDKRIKILDEYKLAKFMRNSNS